MKSQDHVKTNNRPVQINQLINLFPDIGFTSLIFCFLKHVCFSPGGVLDISLGGEVRRGPSYPDPVLRQISLIFLPYLRQNSDFLYPV